MGDECRAPRLPIPRRWLLFDKVAGQAWNDSLLVFTYLFYRRKLLFISVTIGTHGSLRQGGLLGPFLYEHLPSAPQVVAQLQFFLLIRFSPPRFFGKQLAREVLSPLCSSRLNARPQVYVFAGRQTKLIAFDYISHARQFAP